MIAKRFKLPVEEFSKKNRKKTMSFSCFSMKTLPNTLGFNRIGVVVPVRCAALATQRNKIRRQIFDLSSTFPQKGLDILFYIVCSQKSYLTTENIASDMENAANMLR